MESIGALSIVDFCGRDDRIHELGGLSFTSSPVTVPTTISGPISLHLNTRYDTTDGLWAVTVVDVAPDGLAMQLAGGQITASLRAIDEHQISR